MSHKKKVKNEQRILTRRAWIRGVIFGAISSAATALLGDRAIKYFDKISPVQPNPILPSGTPSADPRDWLKVLFGPWEYYSAVPGADNKDYPNKQDIHPDIREPYASILRLWEGSGRILEPVTEENLPAYALGDPLILIGGPVSNSYARKWQGYRRSPITGYIELISNRRPRRRWRFRYDLGGHKEEGPARFVDGKLHRSWPQAIEDLDSTSTGFLSAVTLGEERLLVSDWLVLSFVHNTLSAGSGASIIDASDLHGQGNKAFSQLVNDPWRLEELVKCLESKGIRPGQHFQALYRVDIVHGRDRTFVNGYNLIDVAPA